MSLSVYSFLVVTMVTMVTMVTRRRATITCVVQPSEILVRLVSKIWQQALQYSLCSEKTALDHHREEEDTRSCDNGKTGM